MSLYDATYAACVALLRGEAVSTPEAYADGVAGWRTQARLLSAIKPFSAPIRCSTQCRLSSTQPRPACGGGAAISDRKSTRLNSSH